MNIAIREERETDIEAIYTLNAAAFGREDESKLVGLLRNSESFIPELSLVAVNLNNEVVGHILFTENHIVNEKERHSSLSLAPMAVHPAFQNKGIGGSLIKAGLEKAKTLGYTSVIVLGHENYYPKFGFKPAERWQIFTDYDVPSNVFMAIELVEHGLANIYGRVQYPPAFEMI